MIFNLEYNENTLLKSRLFAKWAAFFDILLFIFFVLAIIFIVEIPNIFLNITIFSFTLILAIVWFILSILSLAKSSELPSEISIFLLLGLVIGFFFRIGFIFQFIAIYKFSKWIAEEKESIAKTTEKNSASNVEISSDYFEQDLSKEIKTTREIEINRNLSFNKIVIDSEENIKVSSNYSEPNNLKEETEETIFISKGRGLYPDYILDWTIVKALEKAKIFKIYKLDKIEE
ncbi:hypothetical protein [[Mycoplasma] mobile]|uniref:Expressed protein n=1 Tax=Mycoplasma mobile (strain ATCC 43663 / 163K / NCTC 11711) TaxID=267748 RepID=Q6KH51_MYCM1|nr:hypothetical protein [[Mycoplasma] mobile]AAT28080.1 expressed protein [Mycoplasma mobile 163K]